MLQTKRNFMIFRSLPFIMMVAALVMVSHNMAATASGTGLSKEKGTVELGGITVNKSTREIRIRSKLAIKEGILEYLMVHNQGKAYESVFKTGENNPSELNFALLLIGCKPINFDTFIKLTNSPEGRAELLKKYPESVLEMVLYQNGLKIPWQTVLKNRSGTIPPLIWAYTGGWFTKDNKYAGDMELSHIGIWPDPSAPINLFSSMGNPYRGGFGLEVNRENARLKVDEDYDILIRRKMK